MVAPVAGSTPTRKPMPVPRRIGMREARQSARVGSTCFTSATGRSDRQHAARHHLAHAEQGHREHDELDAVEQPGLAEVEARDAVLRIDADGAEEQAGHAGGKAFEQRAADCGQRRKAEQHQREVFRRAEGERRAWRAPARAA